MSKWYEIDSVVIEQRVRDRVRTLNTSLRAQGVPAAERAAALDGLLDRLSFVDTAAWDPATTARALER